MDTQKISLYELIGVNKQATQAEITKAYRIMALRVHPDKNPGDYENAQKNFQKLNEAYNILSDSKKRQLYDTTGETEASDEFFEAYEYYRGLYGKLKMEDIDSFAAKYKDSSDEIEDIVRFYLEKNGDMREILHYVPLSERADLPRFWNILDDLIQAKKLPKSKKYEASKKKVRDIKEEKEIIENDTKEKSENNENMMALIRKIKGRQNDPEEFFNHLEEKYGKKPVKKTLKKRKIK
ncbi:hypothetical protein SteCoe_17964 [Stentor coeruleus]|uniref:J domain-containing protein n=1 Tax=Stentor coeruleus TaxID=5963 RepID=A0A1R2BY47_9CILI|nr:hypothetical protein SteCoe_17964 [Stentor coeruleus]